VLTPDLASSTTTQRKPYPEGGCRGRICWKLPVENINQLVLLPKGKLNTSKKCPLMTILYYCRWLLYYVFAGKYYLSKSRSNNAPVQTVPDIGDSEPRGSPKSRQMTIHDVYGRRQPRPAHSGHAHIRLHRICIYMQCSLDNRCRTLSHAFLSGIWAAAFHDPDILYHQLLPPHKRIHSTSNSIAYVCAHQRVVTHTSEPNILQHSHRLHVWWACAMRHWQLTRRIPNNLSYHFNNRRRLLAQLLRQQYISVHICVKFPPLRQLPASLSLKLMKTRTIMKRAFFELIRRSAAPASCF
jgi:hypothetical protein